MLFGLCSSASSLVLSAVNPHQLTSSNFASKLLLFVILLPEKIVKHHSNLEEQEYGEPDLTFGHFLQDKSQLQLCNELSRMHSWPKCFGFQPYLQSLQFDALHWWLHCSLFLLA